MVVASYDPATGDVELAHGGIPPALIVHPSRGECREVGARGLPIGVDEDAIYASASVSMSAGDVLLLTSDGLTESSNREGERYGVERMGRALLEAGEEDGRSLGSILEEDLIGFLDGKRVNDDVTVLAIRKR
jgi:serine phosphatase RsbU (regulator of sigma subunit)